MSEKIQNTYDELTEALKEYLEPTIKTADLRYWCEKRLEDFSFDSQTHDLLWEIIEQFCKTKKAS